MDVEPQSDPSAAPVLATSLKPVDSPLDKVVKSRAVRPIFSLKLFGLTMVGQALAGAVTAVGTIWLSSRMGMAPERALAIFGVVSVLLAAGVGFWAAAWTRKVGFWEVLLSGTIFSVLASWQLGRVLMMASLGFGRPVVADLAYLASMLGSPVGGVALAAVTIWGATFVGCSLGFLLAGSGKLDLRFSYELFVARSHLRLRKRSPTRIMTIISIGGVAVGVLALTVVLSVMSGFELDLKQKIIGTNAHAVVLKYGKDFSEWSEVAEKTRRVARVTGVTPFIFNEVMISSEVNNLGSLIKGIDSKTVDQVTNLPANVKEGSIDFLDAPQNIPAPMQKKRISVAPGNQAQTDGSGNGGLTEEEVIGHPNDAPPAATSNEVLPGILLGKELARSLNVMVGDRVNVVSPLGGDLGPTGPMPKSRPFRVAGVVYSGMYEFDAKFSFIGLTEAQKLFGLGSSVTGLEIKTSDIDNTRQITRNVVSALDGYPYRTRDWGEMNKNLFSALRLEKLVMAVILAFIVLVACFNILSTLIMMVLEKSKEIAILKSMGSTDTSVMKVFVIEGLIIGLIGTAVGLVLGYVACIFVEVVGIKLDAEVYYIDRLPVKVEFLQFAIVALVAILLSYLATIFPATRASRVAPVDGLRNE